MLHCFLLLAAGCTAANGKITCVVGTLTGSRPFTVVLPVTALQSGSQTTTAVVNTTSPDTQPANNAAQQTLVALVRHRASMHRITLGSCLGGAVED